MANDKNPSTPSGAYMAGSVDRRLIHDVTGGLPAIQAGKELYLTRWHDEDQGAYDRRLKDAVWTPLFDDILHGLASKPFSREVGFDGDPPARIEDMAEDIDGEGNNLHVFASRLFKDGIRDKLAGILVDYPVADPEVTTVEAERKANRRPYFVEVKEADLIAIYREFIGGIEVITHARIRECEIKRDGWGEEEIERVRVLEPGEWWLYRKVKGENNREDWIVEAAGLTTLDYVPLVVFETGKVPPLAKIARMQVELYRQENNLKSILSRTAFPLYAANKMTPPPEGEKLTIGPGAVLFGGAEGEWQILEPAGSSIEQQRAVIEAIKQEMRRLGMQPLLPGTGDITATATGVEAAKAHSWVQEKALALKDALEQALMIMGDWIGETVEAEVFVHTDFGVDMLTGQDDQTILMMHEQRVISKETVRDEMKRRGRLAADYDGEEDDALIDAELEKMIDLIPDVEPSTDGSEGKPAPGAQPGKKPPTAKPAAKKPVPA